MSVTAGRGLDLRHDRDGRSPIAARSSRDVARRADEGLRHEVDAEFERSREAFAVAIGDAGQAEPLGGDVHALAAPNGSACDALGLDHVAVDRRSRVSSTAPSASRMRSPSWRSADRPGYVVEAPRSSASPSGLQLEPLPRPERERFRTHRPTAAPSGPADRPARRAACPSRPRPRARAAPSGRGPRANRARSSPGTPMSRPGPDPARGSARRSPGPSVHMSFVRAIRPTVCRRAARPRHARPRRLDGRRAAVRERRRHRLACASRRASIHARGARPADRRRRRPSRRSRSSTRAARRAPTGTRRRRSPPTGRPPTRARASCNTRAASRYARVVSRRCASGSVACVSHPSWVTSTSGANSAHRARARPRESASSHASSPVLGGQRDVDRAPLGVAAAAFAHEPRPGENRNRPDSWIEIVSTRGSSQKIACGAVAVVDVDVDVRDPLGAVREHPRDGDGRVVVHAEPARAAGHRVVQPARRVERVVGPPVPHGLGRSDDSRRRRAPPASCMCGKIGLSPGPYPNRRQLPSSPWPARLVASMNSSVWTQRDLVVGGSAPSDLDARAAVEAVRRDQVPGEQHAVGTQRVLRPVVVDPRASGATTSDGRAAHADGCGPPSTVRSTRMSASSSVRRERRPEHDQVAVRAVGAAGARSTGAARRRGRRQRPARSPAPAAGTAPSTSRSATSSMPIIVPRPRTSPTCGTSVERGREVLQQRAPSVAARSTRPPSRRRRRRRGRPPRPARCATT